MFCTKCGEKQEEGSKFCTNCGAPLEEVKEEKKTTKKEEPKEEEKKEEKVEEKKVEVKETKSVDTGVKIDGKPVVIEKPKEDGKATASLVLGICGFVVFCLGLPLSIIGLILGIVSKEKSGKRTAGIIINSIVLGLSVVVIILYALFFAAAGSIIEEEYENNKDTWNDIIEDKKEDDTKVVGDSTFGYVKIPKNWIEFKDVSGTKAIQYTDIGENGYIVTLNTIDQNVTVEDATKAITEGVKGEGASAYYITTTIGGYSGYVIHAIYTDGTKLDSYIFKTEDNVLRFVSIEGPDKFNDNFDIPKTFTLKK